MAELKIYKREYGPLLRLGTPIAIAQVGITLQGVVDTLMLGQHSARELAAAGFVNGFYTIAILLCVGYAQSAVSQIGMYHAQGHTEKVVSVLKSSLWADTLQAVAVTLLMGLLTLSIPFMGQDPSLVGMMQSYSWVLLPSLVVFSMGGAFRPFLDSIGDTHVSMVILLIGNAWNVLWNWILIYGKWGFPEMGIDGAALATSTSRVAMLLLFVGVFLLSPRYRRYRECWSKVKATRREVLLLNALGWPIAIQMGVEIASFSLINLFLGWGGEGWDGISALTAHQIMAQLATVVYTLFIGVGGAIAIRVSHYHGLDNRAGAMHAADAGYHLILVVSVVMCSFIFAVRHYVTGLFIDESDAALYKEVDRLVVLTTIPLILYQFGDGLQTAYVNALRGYGDVKVLMKYVFIAYVMVSLPLSYLFSHVFDWGIFGAWMGLPFGLTTAGVLYFRRFRKNK